MYKPFAPCSKQITTPTPHESVNAGSSWCPINSDKALKANCNSTKLNKMWTAKVTIIRDTVPELLTQVMFIVSGKNLFRHWFVVAVGTEWRIASQTRHMAASKQMSQQSTSTNLLTYLFTYLLTHTHTHTHTIVLWPSWILSRTTRVSRHQKGKIYLIY